MNITFNNNGVPYHFGDDSCGGGKHLSIRYREVADIQLSSSKTQEKQQKGFLGRLLGGFEKLTETYAIIITYYPSWYDKTKTERKTIAITSSEAESAKAVVAFVKGNIAVRITKAQVDNAKLEQAKKIDTVDVINENGEIEKVWRRQTFFGDTVLVADGGTAYHTHADCFESWLDSYKAGFKHWKKISLADAKAQGYTPCRMCDKYYDFDTDEE